jgi:putative endonuclease
MTTPTMAEYYVYIMTNRSGTLYVGVTNNIARRVSEHRAAAPTGFTARYRLDRLAYYESTHEVEVAIGREKQIRSRSKDGVEGRSSS